MTCLSWFTRSRHIHEIMNTNLLRKRKNENEDYDMHDQLSDSDSEIEIINNCARKKTMRIRHKNVLSTSESEEDYDTLHPWSSSDMQWTMENVNLKFHKFNASDAGLQRDDITFSSSILDYFEIFFSSELMNFIVDKTNNYWAHGVNGNMSNRNIGTTVDELYCFLACTLLMSQNKKLRLSEYWSRDELLRTNIFTEIMSRDKYLTLLKMLHFVDHNKQSSDRLHKIRSVSSKLVKSFKDSFSPYQNLCMDESLLLFKGRLSFKSRVLCDCKTGYVLDANIHAGSETCITGNASEIGKTGKVVLMLIKSYLGKGHTLYVDDYYSSPALFNLLHANATNACGTVKQTRKGMPIFNKKLNAGEIEFRTSNNLLALKWHDKRDVFMLSTFHDNEFVSTGKKNYKTQEFINKPKCIADYNHSMGAVNKCDILISSIESIRKSMKWYKKYFFHLLDIAVWNAYCLYKHKMHKNISIAAFHLQLIRQILSKYHKENLWQSNLKSKDKYPFRLTDRHFPAIYSSRNTKRKSDLRKCVVCSKNGIQRQTHYQCKICDVGLCVCPCFETFHTKLYY